MSELRTLNDSDLEALLRLALETRAKASLRVQGSVRMLGQLRVAGLEPGRCILIEGAKHRDFLPPAGTPICLSIIQGEEVVAIRTEMLEALEQEKAPPMLRAAWPTLPLEFHQREEVRVATPAFPPLEGILIRHGQRQVVKVLNITETGMGLGLNSAETFHPWEQVEVETQLPGGMAFKAEGHVRHFESVEDDALPTRLGLVLLDLPPAVRDSLRSLIQARRMTFSEDIREN